ncbi:MAG: trypsin-like peptidase domain-containing protein [Rhizobiaceae bacterium]|nr:trypsin-like peptidase domain-containing protein [Rhizobiaceae bacterium]
MFKIFSAFLIAIGILGAASCSFADEPDASGTAFAVTHDGWLLTNAHVVSTCTRVEVKGLGTATDQKVDQTNDLALIRISGKDIAPITFRKTPVRLGEDVVAIGFPLSDLLSDSIKVTTGNVNALAGIQNDTRYVQISAPIQPGNSGGPLVDKNGNLLGITSSSLSKQVADVIGVNPQNVNFAIRSSVAELFLQAQGLSYQTSDAADSSATLSTADLADKVTPSVYQVLCYGQAKQQAQTEATPQSQQAIAAGLLDASGYDAIGVDYSTIKDMTYSGCKALCTGDSQCQAITFNSHYGVCFLKKDVVALIRNSDAMSAYSAASAPNITLSNFTVYPNMDIPGGDYRQIVGTEYLPCLLECIRDNNCKAFSYVRRKNECWLKGSLGQPRAMKGVELGVK